MKKQLQGRPRALDDSLGEQDADARLKNWARWAGGAAASVGYVSGATPVPGFNPDEDDAREMEAILVDMKALRPRMYRAVFLAYIARYSDHSSALALRCDVNVFRALLLRAYAWIDARAVDFLRKRP